MQEKLRNNWGCINCVWSMVSWRSIYPPLMDSFIHVGTIPTWENVLTSLIKPLNCQFKGWLWTTTLWDPVTSFWAHPGTPEMWLFLGMLDGINGITEVAIYPMWTTLCWRAVVLATLIQGPIVIGWQTTQLTYKQLRHTNSRYPR